MLEMVLSGTWAQGRQKNFFEGETDFDLDGQMGGAKEFFLRKKCHTASAGTAGAQCGLEKCFFGG